MTNTCTARKPGLAGYTIDGCRCDTCTRSQNAYNNRRNRLIAYQQWEPYVDAEPVRRHVRDLMAAGMGWMHIARITEIPNGAVSRLLYGDKQRPPSRRVRPSTAARLLALRADLDTLADASRIDATRTRRQIQGMVAIGWTLTEQARRIGWATSNYQKLTVAALVEAATARAVNDTFEVLSGTPAPDTAISRRARAAALRNGWAPPLAWDDETIADPDAEPNVGDEGRDDVIDEVAIRRVVDGHARYGDLTLPERKHLVRTYADRVPNLAQKIGMSGGQLKKWVAEMEAAA